MTDRTTRQFANETTVPIAQSKEQITEELHRLGATSWPDFRDDDPHSCMVLTFSIGKHTYRIILSLPDINSQKYCYTASGKYTTSPLTRRRNWIQDCLPKWRQLYLYIKAIRVAKETPIILLEDVLLPYRVLPNGRTVAEWLGGELSEAIERQQMPALPPAQTPSQPQQIVISPAYEPDE